MTSPSAPSSETRDEPGDVRRRLLESAALLIDEDGPDALTARRLAKEAGTSTMAVYTHFGSMAGVVDEVATEGFRRLIAHVDDTNSDLVTSDEDRCDVTAG